MLDSDVNTVVEDPEVSGIVGATINTAWEIDDKLDYFDVDPVMWLNLSAEISLEQTNDPLYATVIFRDFTFQLIYHLIQVLLKHLFACGPKGLSHWNDN
jgi:hypothetical protein